MVKHTFLIFVNKHKTCGEYLQVEQNNPKDPQKSQF